MHVRMMLVWSAGASRYTDMIFAPTRDLVEAVDNKHYMPSVVDVDSKVRRVWVWYNTCKPHQRKTTQS